MAPALKMIIGPRGDWEVVVGIKKRVYQVWELGRQRPGGGNSGSHAIIPFG